MSAIATKIAPTTPMPDPKRAFESAIAQIQQGPRLITSRTPIGMRRRPTAPALNPQVVEKQAVTDAARALAALWHVSPTLVC
jgi:hypothetical protein